MDGSHQKAEARRHLGGDVYRQAHNKDVAKLVPACDRVKVQGQGGGEVARYGIVSEQVDGVLAGFVPQEMERLLKADT